MEPLAAAAVSKAVSDVEGHAKDHAPVDTGALKNSIQGRSTGALSGEVGVGVEYGIFQEFGTYKMAAQPFMTPAAEEVRPSFEAAMRRIVP
jgi:phage protein, HK97 gp10 family